MKNILVLSSGGDAPGMNAAIRAVVRTGVYRGMTVYGAHLGYQGLVQDDIVLMDSKTVANCVQRGGTILRTGRFLSFHEKETRDAARAILKAREIDGVVVIGGDGSFRGATLLEREGGPRVIGIPATIDNDIVGTEYTLGFDTARNTAVQAIDKIRDTASSHNSHFLVEVMGRNAGFLAVDVGIAGGAEFILIPEKPISIHRLVQSIQAPRRKKSSSIIVVAEGNEPYHSITLAKEIHALCGLEYRVCVLGHVQRGGTPTVMDRLLGSAMGERAIDALLKGETQKMIAVKEGQCTLVDFPDPKDSQRTFTAVDWLRMNDILCA